MTVTEMKLLIVLICNATMAFPDQMENLEAGKCKFGNNDLVLWGMSYASCLRECRARTTCTSINVNQKIGECRLNFDSNILKASCGLYVYSEKSNWKQKTLCDRQDCVQADNMKIKSDCTCVIEECPTLTQPVNCALMGNGRLIGHKVAYVSRNTRNRTIPIQRIRCMENGVWSGEPTESSTKLDYTTKLTASTGPGTTTGSIWSVSSTESSTGTTSDPSTSTVSRPQTQSTRSSEPTASTDRNAPTESSSLTKSGLITAPTTPSNPISSDTITPSQTTNQGDKSTDADSVTSAKLFSSSEFVTTIELFASTAVLISSDMSSSSESTISSVSTTTSSAQSTSTMTSTTTETVMDTFFNIYNMSCTMGDTCEWRSTLECRLDRCQCITSLVLDISNQACVQDCPVPPDRSLERYGRTYQEYKNMQIFEFWKLYNSSETLDLSGGVGIQEAMNQQFLACITYPECRATGGRVDGQKMTVWNYYGEGKIEIVDVPWYLTSANTVLYVRDCAPQ